MIPKIIHQVYEGRNGSQPSALLLNIASSWKEQNPSWEYRFWGTGQINTLLHVYYPDIAPIYRALKYDVQRWDFIRYLILYQYGGLYADMDYECLEPFDTLIDEQSCCFGQEPKQHALMWELNNMLGNALIACEPKHYFINQLIEKIKMGNVIETGDIMKDVLNTTGPLMVNNAYSSVCRKEDIHLWLPEEVAPASKDQVFDILNGTASTDLEMRVENAFAIHYFLGSWL